MQINYNFKWKTRHFFVLLISIILTYLFFYLRSDWSPMHRWNRAVGDASFLLIAISMLIGPLSRLYKKIIFFVPWRRELGIYGVILALIHVGIILAGWVSWDLLRLIGYVIHPQTQNYVMLEHGFGLSNIIGIIAIIYGLILAIASSNWSQRLLGSSVWKFLHQSAYVLWMLIVIHTGYFLFIHFQHFHTRIPDPNWAQIPFLIIVILVISLQLFAFIKTWKNNKR